MSAGALATENNDSRVVSGRLVGDLVLTDVLGVGDVLQKWLVSIYASKEDETPQVRPRNTKPKQDEYKGDLQRMQSR